jgi:hypothetical protein
MLTVRFCHGQSPWYKFQGVALWQSDLYKYTICKPRDGDALVEEAVQGLGYIDQAKEQHIKELESLVSKYNAHICSLDMEVQELAKRPMLDQGSCLQTSSLARGIN